MPPLCCRNDFWGFADQLKTHLSFLFLVGLVFRQINLPIRLTARLLAPRRRHRRGGTRPARAGRPFRQGQVLGLLQELQRRTWESKRSSGSPALSGAKAACPGDCACQIASPLGRFSSLRLHLERDLMRCSLLQVSNAVSCRKPFGSICRSVLWTKILFP